MNPELERALSDVGRSASAAAQAIKQYVRSVAGYIADRIIDFEFCRACKAYPNKKHVHLAMYGKNRRIRKKNRDKILKWFRECRF